MADPEGTEKIYTTVLISEYEELRRDKQRLDHLLALVSSEMCFEGTWTREDIDREIEGEKADVKELQVS